MKKSLVVLLALVLTACGTTAQPTPIVIVVTATTGPADVAPVVVPTDTQTSTEVSIDTPIPATATNPPADGAIFTNIAHSGDKFFLQCPPAEITFSLTSLDPNVVDVDLWYRMLDKKSGIYSDWILGKRMVTSDGVNFTLLFSATDINSKARYKEAWFEYQFVGMNKYGNDIGRSDKFQQQVEFAVACP
jgi:hypothetical protein